MICLLWQIVEEEISRKNRPRSEIDTVHTKQMIDDTFERRNLFQVHESLSTCVIYYEHSTHSTVHPEFPFKGFDIL